ncbi:hypothetical protein ZWY2020_028951 [Hordeum vulgare]|nr:hypothetical protein ZWY2020_028951 [Hordeum vulgare]
MKKPKARPKPETGCFYCKGNFPKYLTDKKDGNVNKDPRTKVLPSTTRTVKELPSSSALDSPSVMSKFATSPPARNFDMSPVPDDAMLDTMPDDAMLDTMPDDAMLDTMPDDAMLDTMPDDAMLDTMPDDAMLDTMHDDAMLDTMPDDAMLDTTLPLGAFLDAQIARIAARCDDTSELLILLK